jgi:hypothetical protein
VATLPLVPERCPTLPATIPTLRLVLPGSGRDAGPCGDVGGTYEAAQACVFQAHHTSGCWGTGLCPVKRCGEERLLVPRLGKSNLGSINELVDRHFSGTTRGHLRAPRTRLVLCDSHLRHGLTVCSIRCRAPPRDCHMPRRNSDQDAASPSNVSS